MKYENVLKVLALKNKVTEKEIENEMQLALELAGLDCTAKEFVEDISFFVSKRRYIA